MRRLQNSTRRLLELNAGATANALGIAASMAAGINQTWVVGTHEWEIQVQQIVDACCYWPSSSKRMVSILLLSSGMASP